MTISSNDIGYGTILPECYQDFVTPLAKNCIERWAEKVSNVQALLPSLMDQLRTKLAALQLPDGRPVVTPDHIFVVEYFDPTHDGSPWPLSGFTPFCAAPVPAVRQWGYNSVEVPMNATMARKAAQFGWHYVGGIATDFNGHGYCNATDSWIRSIQQILDQQGSIDGSWHPNSKGQAAIENRFLGALRPSLGLG